MPITTERQANALTEILNIIKPNWHPKAITRTLWENRNTPHPYPLITTTLTTYAQHTTDTTPLYIFTKANWPQTATNPTINNPCQDHPTMPAHNCPACRADTLVGDRPPHKIGKHWNIPNTLNTAGEPNAWSPNKTADVN